MTAAAHPTTSSGRIPVLVPIKDFDQAKLRLSTSLEADQRHALAQYMAGRVLRAAGADTAHVVCDDAGVARWASERGAHVIWCPVRGLNASVQYGVEQLRAAGEPTAIISHADLPLATTYEPLRLALTEHPGSVVVVPDRHGDGTNVLAVPTDAGFCFRYGPGSFRAHRAEAEQLGLHVIVLDVAELQWDVDHPDDLELPDGRDLRADVTAAPRCGEDRA